ncbi:MAG TPA: DUF2314 domain-containing protein [Ohtaekwangia sp.]|uniref:DUF2314 domain-containing protein n=1 Tax=Ohtaekwangia sp. TaxID=2066019 RepID=UPI002F942E0A
MAVQIISIAVVIVIVIYFLKKEKTKEDAYFGEPKKYTKKEEKVLNHYKSIYKSLPNDSRFPAIKRNGYELEDIAYTATQMIYDNPIPARDEIEEIEQGDLVKLLFVDDEGYVERMWVEVQEKDGEIYKGLLRNDAFEFEGLKDGETIYFHSNHIYDIEKK